MLELNEFKIQREEKNLTKKMPKKNQIKPKYNNQQNINQFKFQGQMKKSTNLTKISQKKKSNQYNNRQNGT